jgi:alpha-L-rhamnosidase
LKSHQTAAYEIMVVSEKEKLKRNNGDMWQTGKVISSRTRYVPYQGKPLQSMTTYYWKVRVWDEQGNRSPWSKVANWNMGMLEAGDWQNAKWISSSGIIKNVEPDVVPFSHWIWHPRVKELNREVFFRRIVDLDSTTAFIRLDITAYHNYRLFVNGKLLGNVNREWNTPTTAHYQLYRKRNLNPGKNVIAVQASSRQGPGVLIYGIKRIKNDKNERLKLDWNLKRTIAKANYSIHTDAIKKSHSISVEQKQKLKTHEFINLLKQK